MHHTKEEDEHLIELLLKRQSELNALLEVTRAINNNMPTQFLLEMLEMIMRGTLKVGRFRLLVEKNDIYSCVCQFGGEIENHLQFQQISEELSDFTIPTKLSDHPDSLLNIYDYFIPVYHKNVSLAYVLVGDFETSQQFLNNYIDYIQTLINVIMVALENKKLFKERLQKDRLEREFELAAEVQNMLIPQILPNNEVMDVCSTYLPTQNVGGDFFDFIKLNSEEVLWCIADVSGKGISAALLMANFQASLRALVSVEVDLCTLIEKINTIAFNNTKGDNFITLFIGKYNSTNRKLNYINAGHNATLLFQNEETILLKQGTVMIGAFDNLPFIKEGEITVGKNAFLFNYTDGVIDYDGEDGLAFSEESLIPFIKSLQKFDCKHVNTEVVTKLKELRNDKQATDDITILSLKIY
jgi:sigma-B regulation protein RsbU (phosphoserine phosphatase)